MPQLLLFWLYPLMFTFPFSLLNALLPHLHSSQLNVHCNFFPHSYRLLLLSSLSPIVSVSSCTLFSTTLSWFFPDLSMFLVCTSLYCQVNTRWLRKEIGEAEPSWMSRSGKIEDGETRKTWRRYRELEKKGRIDKAWKGRRFRKEID